MILGDDVDSRMGEMRSASDRWFGGSVAEPRLPGARLQHWVRAVVTPRSSVADWRIGETGQLLPSRDIHHPFISPRGVVRIDA
jgi:hypothetical protein